MALTLDRAAGALFDAAGRRFDPAARSWQAGGAPQGAAVATEDAARWLQTETPHRVRAPIGVIGPREPTAEQLAVAEALGAGLAGLGVTVICGGMGGVMAATCRGVEAAGGISIGLLPAEHWSAANPHVTIPVATGIGVARNAIIARAAFCLVAVGGGYGTLSEVAFGLQFGRPVFGLAGAPEVAGLVRLDGAAAAVRAVAACLLALPPGV